MQYNRKVPGMVHPPLTFFLRKSPDFPLRPCVHSDRVDEDKYWILQKEQNVTHDKHIVGEKRKQHIKEGPLEFIIFLGVIC